MQQRWIRKLLSYDFVVEYKVANSLSRMEKENNPTRFTLISMPSLNLLSQVKEQYKAKPMAGQPWEKVAWGDIGPKYTIRKWCLYYKGWLYIPNEATLKLKLLQILHSSPMVGNSVSNETLERVTRELYWPSLKVEVHEFVKRCDIFQRVKPEKSLPGGLLKNLPIPSRPWTHITMDFIEGSPPSQSYNCIWFVMDQLTKYNHFIPLSHPYIATNLAQSFIKHIFNYHGMSDSIVLDQDKALTRRFWFELFKRKDIELALSTTYHPQSDGQYKAINKTLENYLRCFARDMPKD